MRYFFELAYLGTAYHGWQRQPNALSVQEIVEEALSKLMREPIEILGAGRTDAGVHARQLFAHFDSEHRLEKDLALRMNSLLPEDIVVKGLQTVQTDAHARFDALSRSYEYLIVTEKDPFSLGAAFCVKRRLDMERMNSAAEILLEYTSFKCFSRSRTDVKTFNCKIEYAFWEKEGNRLVFRIKADRFLRNMVRAIVGTLLEVGLGKIEEERLHQIIASKDRSQAGASVPAHGLYLTQVEYPQEIFLD